MIDLDHDSLDRVLPAAAGPADWDDVLRRSIVARENRRRAGLRLAGHRRLAVAFAAVALLAVLATSALGVRAFVLDRGFIGLPPKGATPSTPEEGELVLHWRARSATLGGPMVDTWVYADGRVIWAREGSILQGANAFTSGYLEQRLTPDGVELLRSRLIASGLFDGSLTLLVRRDHGSVWGELEVRQHDQFVRLRWKALSTDPAGTGDGQAATPAQLSALGQLDPLITDPGSELPSSAWADRAVRAYVPSHYSVCLGTAPPKSAAGILTLLPARAKTLLRDRAWSRSSVDVVQGRESGPVVVGRYVSYCSKVPTEEAREIAGVLTALEPDTRVANYSLAYRLAEGDDDWEVTSIGFDAYLPHGRPVSFAGG